MATCQVTIQEAPIRCRWLNDLLAGDELPEGGLEDSIQTGDAISMLDETYIAGEGFGYNGIRSVS